MNQKDKRLVIIAVVIIVAAIIISDNLSLTVNVPSDGSNDQPIINLPSTDFEFPVTDDSEAPTSMRLEMEPLSAPMGSTFYGDVTSDGKDYPIMVHALLVGTGTEQSYGGRLSNYGSFYDDSVINIPGYWDFWVSADNEVESNKPRVTVEGVKIVPERLHYSKTFGGLINCELFSHTSGNAQIIAIDAEHMIMIPMTSTTINTNGYGTIALDFSPSTFSTGTYEITVLINGLDSADFGTNPFIEVGR